MLPDWFNETVNAVTPGSGATTLDEWGFCQVLGADGCRSALTEHWDNWITEADFDTMVEYGINHVRLPTGFWAWIPTIEGEPFLNDTALYQAQIEKVLGWAYDRGMYVLIDAHGLPGSQNGEQASGHLTKEPSWFGGSADTETPNQIRSDQMVVAMTEFLARTPYRSVVTGLEVINEPRPYTPDQVQQLMNYYERSYQTIQGSAWPVATFLADGYQGLSNWTSFAEAHVTSPPSMVMVDVRRLSRDSFATLPADFFASSTRTPATSRRKTTRRTFFPKFARRPTGTSTTRFPSASTSGACVVLLSLARSAH